MERSSRAKWAKRVERWKDSGLTAKEFAAETGVNASTLSYWRWKLGTIQEGRAEAAQSSSTEVRGKRRGKTKSLRSPAGGHFVEVVAPMEVAPPAMLEVVLQADVRVRVPVGFDEATLAGIVRAVGAAQ
jgi:hypothetical protein